MGPRGGSSSHGQSVIGFEGSCVTPLSLFFGIPTTSGLATFNEQLPSPATPEPHTNLEARKLLHINRSPFFRQLSAKLAMAFQMS